MNESRKYVLQIPEDYKPTASKHPYYGAWATMLSRCRNPNAESWPDYGGRGISVCPRWETGEKELTGFECFLLDMGLKPTKKHSLHRLDNDGNYSPENCVWATDGIQANHRRNNRLIKINGESVSMMTAAIRFGISYFVLRSRLNRGWSVNQALMVPPHFRYFAPKVATGEKLPQTKLTEEKVRQIRTEYERRKPKMLNLAKEFGISAANVCLIVNRKSWSHVK